MVIWSGMGFLIGFFGIGCLILTEMCVNGAMHSRNYYELNGWPKLLGLWLAAAISWPLGRSMHRGAKWKTIDRETGKPVEHQHWESHSLFFIPVQYWWAVYLVLGVVALFV